MTQRGFIALLMNSVLVAALLVAINALFGAAGIVLVLKKDFASGKKNLCLSDVVSAENTPAREAEKLSRYCRIELKAAAVKLTAKEVELHAWAAGVIPEKITGSQITVTRSAVAAADTQAPGDTTRKIRRGTTVKLILKSENMTIAREAAVLMDAFPGETVDVRLNGTRKNLRAKLVDTQTAEVTQ